MRALRWCAFVCCIPAPALAFRTGENLTELSGSGPVAFADSAPRFRLHVASVPPGLLVADAESAIVDALDLWGSPECTAVSPKYQGVATSASPGDGINSIAWIRDWSRTGMPAEAAGFTDVQYATHDGAWRIDEADVYINAESFTWSTTGKKGTHDFRLTVAHELGHALGLLHPCEEEREGGAPACTVKEADSLMYPFYEGAASRALGADDEAGMCYLYPAPASCGACPEGQECVGGTCTRTCLGEPCRPGESCGAMGCEPPRSCAADGCAGEPCAGDAECGLFARCEMEVCTPGTRPLGAACERSSDCSQAACVERVCEPRCVQGTSCGSELSAGECREAAEPQAFGCVDSGVYPLDSACRRGEDCSSGLCLTTKTRSLCTVPCADQACPNDWSCQRVNDRDVCLPLELYAEGGACALAAPLPGRNGRWAYFALMGGLATWLARSHARRTLKPFRENTKHEAG